MVGEVAVAAWTGSGCLLVPKNAAVVAAPTAAEAPATAARVSLLMVAGVIVRYRDEEQERLPRRAPGLSFCLSCLRSRLAHEDRVICYGSFKTNFAHQSTINKRHAGLEVYDVYK